jgi:hypothetical protein
MLFSLRIRKGKLSLIFIGRTRVYPTLPDEWKGKQDFFYYFFYFWIEKYATQVL